MDPISILTIATSAITFIDFLSKIISRGNELYRDNVLLEHADLIAMAEQLRELRRDLPHFPSDSAPDLRKNTVQTSTTALKNLHHAHERCVLCADQVLEAIDRCRISGQRGRWKSFRLALESVLGEKKLDAAVHRLSEARQQYILYLLLHKRNIQDLPTTSDIQQCVIQALKQVDTDAIAKVLSVHDRLGQHYTLQNAQDTSQPGEDAQAALYRISKQLNIELNKSTRSKLIKILKFPQIRDRYDTVPKAHRKTYGWAVQQGSQTSNDWDNLAHWMSSKATGHNTYWVTGEPGSGKSTLMKYLASSPTTLQLFDQWADGSPVVLASCYFWAPGTELQRSMEGLLRTLILQIIEDEHTPQQVFESTYPAIWERWWTVGRSSKAGEHELGGLDNLFQRLLDIVTQTSNVALFVDGLDEYGKTSYEREQLIDMFSSLEKLPRVKMCLSSRPWNIFCDAFHGRPSLRLEELNRPDIEAYVVAECAASTAFQDLEKINRQRT